VAFKLNIHGFQAAFGIALWVALAGKRTSADETSVVHTKWTSDGDPSWAMYHRANVGPWVNMGYAIEVGPVEIVPSVTWMMHGINDLDNDGIPPFTIETDFQLRAMNVMINCGAQWGF
jgi:hypothetical protein